MRALVVSGAAGPETVDAVCARLARLGVGQVRVIAATTPDEVLRAVAEGLVERTLVVDATLIVADASLGQLVDDPAVRTGALVGPIAGPAAGPQADPDAGPGRTVGSAAPVRVVQRRIASAGSARHDVTSPTDGFLGAVVVGESDAPAARDALRAATDLADTGRWSVDPVDLVLVTLVRAAVPVSAVASVGPVLRGGTSDQRAEVLDELAGLDEARVLLERANRPDDGFYSTFVLRRASKPVTALALRLSLTPNQVSVFSLFVGLAAALSFAYGSWWALLVGAVLMQASLIIDCVDGEVARFTRSFSALGAWLDAASDRVKEYAAYAGLAWGVARGGGDIWLLATLVMVMQTVRHMGDYGFSRVQRIRESWVPTRDLSDPSDGGAAGSGATLAMSARLNEVSRVRWAKKVLHMPIGERWLVLSLGAITIGPRATLILLLVLGLIALAYTSVGRILRARRWRHPADRSGWWLLAPQLDLGPLGEPVWRAVAGSRSPLAAAFGWAVPAAMRLIELAVVWLLVCRVVPDQGAWLFAWVFVVAFHHYDTLYRALGGSTPPRWLVWSGLGWEGRTLVVLVAGALGGAALTGVLVVGSPLLGLLFVVIASAQWIGSLRRADSAGSGSGRKDGAHA